MLSVQQYWEYYCNETVNRTSDTLTHGFGVYYDGFVDGDCKAIAGGDTEDYLPKPVTNEFFVDSSGQLVTYSEYGGPCLEAYVNSMLRIEWVCNNDTEFEVTAIQGGTAITQCVVKLQIESKYACPISTALDSFAPSTDPTLEPTVHPIVPQPLTDYDCNGLYDYNDDDDDEFAPRESDYTFDVQAFDVCTASNVILVPGVPGISIGSMYQCHEGSLWLTRWTSLGDGTGGAGPNNCSDFEGNSQSGPQMVDSLSDDMDAHCSGIWNCPYALVREYRYGCNDTMDPWQEHAYITGICTVVNDRSYQSSMLMCDDSEGLTLVTFNNLNCTGNISSTETYLESGVCAVDSDDDQTYRRLMECGDRSNDTQPEFNTAAPTPAPTGGGKNNNDNDDETWMIVAIVGICVIVVIAVVVGGIMCCSQKQRYADQ